MKMSQLKAGDVVTMTEYRSGRQTTETFLGFTGIEDKYADTPQFNTLKEVKKFYGCTNASQIDALGDEFGYPYGHNVYACFESHRPVEDGGNFKWQAYLYEGRWVLGSGCTRFTIEKV